MIVFRRKPILIFLGITFGLSFLLYIPMIGMGLGTQGGLTAVLMWCPGIAAILTSRI